MPEKLQKMGLINPGDTVPSTEVTPDKPFNECVLCTFCQNGCSGPNLLVTEIERICDLMQARRIALHWSYQKLADIAGIAIVTVQRILNKQVKDPSFQTMQKLAFALFADSEGKFPCPKQLLMSEQDSVEVERLKEQLDAEQKKVAYLKEQVTFKEQQMQLKDKQIEERGNLLQERKDFLLQKDAEIAELKKERKEKRLATAVLSLLLAAALVYITFTLTIDYRNPYRGFWWMYDSPSASSQE